MFDLKFKIKFKLLLRLFKHSIVSYLIVKFFLFLLQQILKKENKINFFCKEQLSDEDVKNYESDLR